MNKFPMMTLKLVAVVQILAIILLSGCGALCTQSTLSAVCHATGDQANPYEEITLNSAASIEHSGHPNDIFPVPAGGCPTSPVAVIDGKITICHATSSQTNPYNLITVSVNGLNGHDKHTGDLIPAPANGCPTSPVVINTGNGNGDGKITICHANGSETNPYDEITVNIDNLNGHDKHTGDIIPAPVNGCPTSPVVIIDGKITICHATNSETNPYDEIKLSVNGLNGHDKHAGDIIPAPEGGCPTSLLVIRNGDGKITICHATGSETNPYNEITISVNGLNGHDKHKDDIIPAPKGGCPTSPVVITNGKITICHATSSETNPYNEITISVNGLNGHDKHEGDIIPAPEGGCPKSPLTVTNNSIGKITICHATSSKTNPYNEITVSVNGLNGHNKHSGDIIPAPAGGCPTTKK